MNLALTTAPTTEPATLTEAKLHARVDIVDDDPLITSQIISARTAIENYTGRKLIDQTWTASLDAWPSKSNAQWWDGSRTGAIGDLLSYGTLDLPFGPILSVTSVTTYDDADAPTVVSASSYYVDMPGARIVPRSGFGIPSGTRVANALVVVWRSGWASAAAVPAPLKHAVLLTVASMYESRGEASGAGTATVASMTLPPLARALADPYRVMRGALL